MKPTDIILQLLGYLPSDNDIIWDSDVIRIDSSEAPIHFRQTNYTRVDINLSQGIAIFLIGHTITLRLAIQASLRPISATRIDPEENDLKRQQQNDDTL